MNEKTLIALALPGVISATATASAQSNVTTHDVIDAAVRPTTNQGAAGSNQSQVVEGAFQYGRLGFEGSEDLGSGTSAVFKLENGFHIDTAGLDQQGQLCGRQAHVDLKSNDLGEIDLDAKYPCGFKWVLSTASHLVCVTNSDLIHRFDGWRCRWPVPPSPETS